MRALIVAALLLIGGIADAQPLRVTIECEEQGRTKACPAFLLGFVDAHPVLLQSPRAQADVVVYASAAEVVLVDRIQPEVCRRARRRAAGRRDRRRARQPRR